MAWAKPEWLTVHGFIFPELKTRTLSTSLHIIFLCVSYSPDIQGVILEVKPEGPRISLITPMYLTSYCSNGPTHLINVILYICCIYKYMFTFSYIPKHVFTVNY